MRPSFDETTVAAAFDVPAAPPGPPARHQQALDLAPREIAPASTGAERFRVGTLTLVGRPGGLWVVRDLVVHGQVRHLSATGHWSTKGGDGPDWQRTYWHDFDKAVLLATDDHRCPCCGSAYKAESRSGVRNASACSPPTEDEAPVAGYGDIEIPAWCADHGAFVWRGAEGLEFDR
jgi:hypothetical protein